MKTPTVPRQRRLKLLFHHHAYLFVADSLHTAQEIVAKQRRGGRLDETHHISGRELLEGIRVHAQRQYGLMAAVVFRHWGLQTTDDIGRIVFDLIERGEMRKSENDRIEDFHNVYSFQTAFSADYRIDVSKAFAEG